MTQIIQSVVNLVTYSQAGSPPRAGLALKSRIADAANFLKDDSAASVLGILANWDLYEPRLRAIHDLPPTIDSFDLSAVALHAPILYPSTVYCAGANYRKHVQAMSTTLKVGMTARQNDSKPWHFLKAPRAIVGTGATVPASSPKLDWEAELVAVIGRECAGVDPASALQYVAGYTIANDLSARDLMRRSDQPDSAPFHWDWLGHKSFDGACPLGPWIVPAFAIPDPQQLSIRLWVDDRLRQDGNTSEMIFTVAEQISHLSRRMTLFPGDIVLTGTPSGVGAESNEYLVPGNRVRIEIENIGDLQFKIGSRASGLNVVEPAA